MTGHCDGSVVTVLITVIVRAYTIEMEAVVSDEKKGFFSSRLYSFIFQRAEIHYVAVVRHPNLETNCFRSCVQYSTLQPSAHFSKESVEGSP